MAFEIKLAPEANLDIAEAAEYIAGDSPIRAQRWLDDLFAALDGLQELPLRHALIPEAKKLHRALRSILHHSHRVIYEVQENAGVVYVVRVYHGARRPLSIRDIE